MRKLAATLAAMAIAATPLVASVPAQAATPSPVVGGAITPDDGGYYAFQADGGVLTYGDAIDHGSLVEMGVTPNKPIVGGTLDPATGGYWMVGGDGGVFSFDAPFYGSTGNIRLNQPIVGMAATPDGGGYWFVAADGGVFSFGDAQFYGSLGGQQIPSPIVDMASNPAGGGYWLVAASGQVYPFGAAQNYGDASGPAVGIAATYTGHGYAVELGNGQTVPEGDADEPLLPDQTTGRPTVAVMAQSDGLMISLSSSGQATYVDGIPWAPSYGQPDAYSLNFPPEPDGTPVRWACSHYPITVYYDPAGQSVQPNVADDLARVSAAMGVPFEQVSDPADADVTIGWGSSPSGRGDYADTVETEGYTSAGELDLAGIAITLDPMIGDSAPMATDVLLHELGHEGLADTAQAWEEENLEASPTGGLLGRWGQGDLAGLWAVGAGSPCLSEG